MAQQPIRFDDGEAYERGMGGWSQLAGQVFLDWVKPPAGLRWIDVGCGNGAFTELLMQRCAPAEVQGIDPSDGQLRFARTRAATRAAVFQQGDAMALPFGEDRFDAAVMALVIFFVPEPAKGVAEMVRVVAPGGIVAAYAWDLYGGGFPFAPIQAELREMGFTPQLPPSADVSRMDALHGIWTGSGLEAVETREITVNRTFEDFEAFWASSTAMAHMRPLLDGFTAHDLEQFKQRARARVSVDAAGHVSHRARANAIKGRVPRGD